MSVLKDVFAELISMFITDARLTFTTLGLVAFVAALIKVFHVGTNVAGVLLLVGSIAIVVEAAIRETQKRMVKKPLQ